jgi:hypothetical protein
MKQAVLAAETALLTSRRHADHTAPNQVRNIITAVKVVYRWAESRELITRNHQHLYRTPGGTQHRRT